MKLIDALQGKNTGAPPVWFMRQAGRYMPAYRAIREKYSFVEMVKTPELATQVTLLPQELGVDALILFSDILMVLQTFNLSLEFKEGVGPVITPPLSSMDAVSKLDSLEVSQVLEPIFKAIKMIRAESKLPLIGFCGGPFTVASYLIEGGSSKDFKKTKTWAFEKEESFHLLLEKITRKSIEYVQGQIQAGVQAIQIFESWAHVLSRRHFLKFCLPYLKKIQNACAPVPVILFARGSSIFAEDLATLAPSAISLDWNASLGLIRKKIPSIGLQGNLDPDLVYAPDAILKGEVKSLLQEMYRDPAYIFNLGHGIKPDMCMNKIKRIVEWVKEG